MSDLTTILNEKLFCLKEKYTKEKNEIIFFELKGMMMVIRILIDKKFIDLKDGQLLTDRINRFLSFIINNFKK